MNIQVIRKWSRKGIRYSGIFVVSQPRKDGCWDYYAARNYYV